jgi:hypothetical protein
MKLKPEPLPAAYILTMLALTLLLEVLPYLEEFWRGWRYNRRTRKPRAAGQDPR